MGCVDKRSLPTKELLRFIVVGGLQEHVLHVRDSLVVHMKNDVRAVE